MELDAFIDQWIEGYLLHDLQNMAKLPLDRSEAPCGGAGYPMLTTTVAGMELLGLLLMPDGTSFSRNGRDHFANYWNSYFVPTRPLYLHLGDLFYKLIRHGIAHVFVAKNNVIVTKNRQPTLGIDRQRCELRIDCTGFYRDFEASYWEQACPIIRGARRSSLVSRGQMQTMLSALLASDQGIAEEAFRVLPSGLDLALQIPREPPPSTCHEGEGPTGPRGPSGPHAPMPGTALPFA
jgi:hypothetical protein